MDKNKQILERILSSRKEQSISKEEFAKMLGCTVRIINYWETDRRGISIDMADKALRLLGIEFVLGHSSRQSN